MRGGGARVCAHAEYDISVGGATRCKAVELAGKKGVEFTVEDMERAFLRRYAWRAGCARGRQVDLQPHAVEHKILEACAVCNGKWKAREEGGTTPDERLMALARHPLAAYLGYAITQPRS